MRDVFENYDSWLEQPYQDACDASDKAEWIAENTTYTTACCGEPVEAEVALPLLAKFAEIKKATGKPSFSWTDANLDAVAVRCPKCGNLTDVDVHEPAEYDGDYDGENGGDRRDD